MDDKPLTIEMDGTIVNMGDMIDITRGLVADENRFDNLCDNVKGLVCLVALKDYLHCINCDDGLNSLNYKILDAEDNRAGILASICLYCEMRCRATRGHNEELAEKYRAYHDKILKRCFRIMKKPELDEFLALIA